MDKSIKTEFKKKNHYNNQKSAANKLSLALKC